MSTKICPKCNELHEKTGTYCSRTCANSRGPRSEEFKKLVSNKLKGKTGINSGKELLPRIIVNCCGCGTQLRILEKEFRKYKTCGAKSCILIASSIGGRKSAKIRINRSKNEIKLFELCSTSFRCKSNHIIADGWDADIVLPEHKIAILWNGPWHYTQMPFNNHSLKQVQNRDKIKTNLFESLGWKVLVFEDRTYTPESAFNELINLIDNK
jgi:hypothetical protein